MTARALALRFAAAGIAVVALVTCSGAHDRYQGISLTAGNADETLRALAQHAAGGDKHAQLALGIRFESGDGVPVDLRRAERMYRAAATTSDDEREVYYPSVFMKTEGKLMRRHDAPRYGLPEAEARLEALRLRRRAAGRGQGATR